MKKLNSWRRVFWVIFMTVGMLHAAQPGVIVLQANESSPYWSEKLPDGGMCGEIVQAISQEMGMKTTIEFHPLKRIIADTTNNPLGNPIFYMSNQDFGAIIPIAVSYSAFFSYRKGAKNLSSSLPANYKNRRIGVLRGTIGNTVALSQFGQFEESYTRDSLFKKLKAGRIDAVLELNLIGRESIRKLFPNEVDNFEVEVVEESAAPIAIMIDSDYPGAIEIGRRYREGFHRIIKNGVHRKILQKYYGKTSIPATWYNDLSRFETLYASN